MFDRVVAASTERELLEALSRAVAAADGRKLTVARTEELARVVGVKKSMPCSGLVRVMGCETAAWFGRARNGLVPQLMAGLGGGPGEPQQWVTVEQVHRHWLNLGGGAQGKHPLAELVRKWADACEVRDAVQVEPVRKEARIAPATLAITSREQGGGGRFSRPASAPDLTREARGPCLPLSLYDLGVCPGREGRGAPLALRVWMEAVLWAPLTREGAAVSMQIPLREFLAHLYPRVVPRRREYMPRLERVQRALDDSRMSYALPCGGRFRRRMVVLHRLPEGAGRAVLAEPVELVVSLPPGSDHGPLMSPGLGEWGVRSAPAYRALIGVAYRWFRPGRTHFPVRRRGGRTHWVRSYDPRRYPVMTDEELVRMCYPTAASRTFRSLVGRARGIVRKLEEEGEIEVRDGRILPVQPASNVSSSRRG